MKAKYVNPFLHASVNLFREFLGLRVSPGDPYVMGEKDGLKDVSALIGLAGETSGAVVLSFEEGTALKVVSRLEGRNRQFLDAQVLDGVGELVNIIAGNAKKDLEEFRIQISLPGVITGSNHRIKWPSGVPVICIPFESELGSFTVNVSLQE